MKFQALSEKDLGQAAKLMLDTGVRVAGLRSPKALLSLCNEACQTNKYGPVILLAKEKGEIRGYVIAIVNSRKYWASYVLNHPLLSAMIALNKSVKFTKRKLLDTEGFFPGDGCNKKPFARSLSINQRRSDSVPTHELRSWHDSGQNIANIIYIAVQKKTRGQGIGSELYRQLFKVLKQKGIARVDANISCTNASGIKLHLKTGWKLFKESDYYFATRDFITPKSISE